MLLAKVAVVAGIVGALLLVSGGDTPHETCFRAAALRVLVATDEEWREAHGRESEELARGVVQQVTDIFRPVCIRLQVSAYAAAASSKSSATVMSLARDTQSSVQAAEGTVVLLLTSQHLHGSKDGWAISSGVPVVVVHHHEEPGQDAIVGAHELGHVLGLGHADPPCECVMNPKGFFREWCPFHAATLRAQATKGGDLLLGEHHSEGKGGGVGCR